MASKKGPEDRDKTTKPGKGQKGGTQGKAGAQGKAGKAAPREEVKPLIPPRPPFPPIIFRLNPTISSVSPPGAIVGSADLPVSVFGSGYNSGSTVEWNQTPLTTTLISNTQLNTTVPAADLATVGPAVITVSNPALLASAGPLVSNGVTFNVIPDISAIISQLQAISDIPAALLAELQTYVTLEQGQVDSLTSQVSSGQTTISALNAQVANQQTTITDQQNQIATLTAQVNAQQAQTASPLVVAQSFKSVVDTIQQNAQAAGGVQSTVTNMNVQIKSLVNVQPATDSSGPQATLIFPSPTALPDPAHLSTISLSFGAIPSLQRPAAPSPGPTPTPPTPAPSFVSSSGSGTGPAPAKRAESRAGGSSEATPPAAAANKRVKPTRSRGEREFSV